MPLLQIKASKKVKVVCSLEESTARMVDQYALFIKAAGDDVVNQALEYTFGKDADFQKFLQSNPSAPSALRVKLPVKPAKQPLRGAKGQPSASIAAD